MGKFLCKWNVKVLKFVFLLTCVKKRRGGCGVSPSLGVPSFSRRISNADAGWRFRGASLALDLGDFYFVDLCLSRSSNQLNLYLYLRAFFFTSVYYKTFLLRVKPYCVYASLSQRWLNWLFTAHLLIRNIYRFCCRLPSGVGALTDVCIYSLRSLAE